jgi:glucose-6-phosphate-specific signal transduction histidine kinase
MRRFTFQERAERVLITALLVAIAMIAQQFSIQVYRWGLLLLVAATLLQIAVANLPKDCTPREGIVMTVGILVAIACVFGVGILLAPVLTQLGR